MIELMKQSMKKGRRGEKRLKDEVLVTLKRPPLSCGVLLAFSASGLV